jgi:hypothetical protein
METQYIHHVQNVSEADLASLGLSDSAIEEEDIPQGDEWYCELNEIDAQIFGETFVSVQGLNESFFEDNAIVSGEFTLMAPDAWIENGEMIIPSDGLSSEAEIEPLGKEEDYRRRLSSGTKTVLVVRIDAPDVSTTANEQTLYNEVFLGDSLTKTYSDCSHGELNLIPYTGNGVKKGITTVSITENVVGTKNAIIRNAAVQALNDQFGRAVQQEVDYVMLCIPPGSVSASNGW